jgi:hypothetical protein
VLSVTIFCCVSKVMLITCCYIYSNFYFFCCSKILEIKKKSWQLVRHYFLFVLLANVSFKFCFAQKLEIQNFIAV